MKTILMCVCLGMLAGCQSRNELGDCIGLMDDPDPKLHYKLSIRNVVVGGIFFQTIFAPAIVVATELQCPDKKVE